MIRVAIEPELLRWARERAGLRQKDLVKKFNKLPQWETGQVRPTLKQIEAFARAVHVPEGYLFLSRPPDEPVPIPDFRTIAQQTIHRPSPNLLDTIYACQERQNWYREFARSSRQPLLQFVGSVTPESPPDVVAAKMQELLGFSPDDRRKCSTWTDALRLFIRYADEAGVLVMVSGIVASNTHRKLDPDEFRGFALSDPVAPLVFVNGADTKAAQMFTLAHEIAHLWLGVSGISDIDAGPPGGVRSEETWCNTVAAEFLVPLDSLRPKLRRGEALPGALQRLARDYKVSSLVILRRLLDTDWLDRTAFDAAWRSEIARLRTLRLGNSDGGHFYRATLARVGRRFAGALVESTLEGQTLYRDAYRMLGISRSDTFHALGREVGVLG